MLVIYIVLLDPGASSQVFTLKNFIRHYELPNSLCVLYFNNYFLKVLHGIHIGGDIYTQ